MPGKLDVATAEDNEELRKAADGEHPLACVNSANDAYKALVPHKVTQSLANNTSGLGTFQSMMAGKTKIIALDSQSFLYSRRQDGKESFFGEAQLEWLRNELS